VASGPRECADDVYEAVYLATVIELTLYPVASSTSA